MKTLTKKFEFSSILFLIVLFIFHFNAKARNHYSTFYISELKYIYSSSFIEEDSLLFNLNHKTDTNLTFKSSAFDWKSLFTLEPNEGTRFTINPTPILDTGGVPILHIAPDTSIILTSAFGPQIKVFRVKNNGKTYEQIFNSFRPGDGGFVYLPDGRIRFLYEQPAPNSTPQKHRSQIRSKISNDGITWIDEAGIRYLPGLADDSIASVPSIIQIQDSIWRMYYVGDWYNTNGIRTAISTNWGLSWSAESVHNILRKGDVDPHPVYLTNGKIRLYFRNGFGSGIPENFGISYCESSNGLNFDTTQIKLILKDSDMPVSSKLDPAVIKFPNGDIACYIGGASMNSPNSKMLIAWAEELTKAEIEDRVDSHSFELYQNYPNPFSATGRSTPGGNPSTNLSFVIGHSSFVSLKVFDVLGREVATLVDEYREAGDYKVEFDASNLCSGIYIYVLKVGEYVLSKKAILIK